MYILVYRITLKYILIFLKSKYFENKDFTKCFNTFSLMVTPRDILGS